MLQRPCQSWKHAARDPRPACTPSTPFPGQVLATNAGASGALGAHKNGARCDPRSAETQRAVIPALPRPPSNAVSRASPWFGTRAHGLPRPLLARAISRPGPILDGGGRTAIIKTGLVCLPLLSFPPNNSRVSHHSTPPPPHYLLTMSGRGKGGKGLGKGGAKRHRKVSHRCVLAAIIVCADLVRLRSYETTSLESQSPLFDVSLVVVVSSVSRD